MINTSLFGLLQPNNTDRRLISSRHLFLIVLEAGKRKIKVSADSVSSTSLPPASETVFLLYPHMVGGARELSGVSHTRAPIPHS